MKRKSSGITLIALVITIIILIILAGISINLVFGKNGIISRSKEAKFKSKMSEIAEQWSLYKTSYFVNNIGSDGKELYAGEILKEIISTEELEIDESKVQNIKTLIPKVGTEEEKYVMIYEGELYYVSQSTIENNEKQAKWCEQIGIKIYEYESTTGITVVNGKYELVNGVYVCTPKINTGFSQNNTRYVKEKNSNLVPGNWINKKPDNDWYDYKNKKWANIYVESNGIESYYVWIPRYAYKISETENQRMDVKFVDVDNSYINAETGEKTTWEELQKQGYKVPEAFYWGDNEDYSKNTPISGYWMSKYQLSESTDTYTIDFETTATPTSITIKGISTNTTKTIAKYTYAINGKIIHESTKPEDYEVKNLAKGNRAINVTILDEKGEIIGSMTKLYEVAEVNEPDLTGFDKDTTFYVYWDENGIEHNEIPIREKAPEQWYDYSTRNWANIVSRNNGLESYFVWIPRYQYTLDQTSQRSYVKFIKGISTQTDTGYKIPEAFTWGDNGEKQLTGFWMSKYQLSSEESTPKIDAEMSAGSSVIRVRDITGTLVKDGLKYEYYLDGKKVKEGTSATENYSYTGLNANTTYTINIIARNSSTNEYVGAITKKIKTTDANKPDLTGFNEQKTYYVLYDENDNMTIGEQIKNDGRNMPNGWYDYSQRKWANIVVTDGTIQNGQITGATSTSYFVWIPRYEYRILTDRGNLSTSNRRIEVNFIQGTSNEITPGYKVPEAFYWGDNEDYKTNTPIKGYWMSKYQLSE